MDAYQALTNGRPGHKSSVNTFKGKTRSHHSMPPPSRNASHMNGTTFASFNRMSYQPGIPSAASSTASIQGRDVHLPEDLEKVLTVLAGGILEGHIKLAAALRRRYEDQYPLIRTLADVFTAHVRHTPDTMSNADLISHPSYENMPYTFYTWNEPYLRSTIALEPVPLPQASVLLGVLTKQPSVD